MIYVRNQPLRVSLLGGGTDLPENVEVAERVGRCLVTSIPQSIQCVVEKTRDSEDKIFHVDDQRIDTPLTDAVFDYDVNERSVSELSDTFHSYRVRMGEDLPTRGTGLGSSAAWVRVLSDSINDIHRKDSGLKYRERLTAQECYDIERSTGSACGYQDHVAALHLGTNLFTFKKIDNPTMRWGYMIDEAEVGENHWLHRSMILLRVPGRRDSNVILARQAARMHHDEMSDMAKLALKGFEALKSNDARVLGHLVRDSWEIKKQYAPGVTTEEIDELVEYVSEYAFGAKILGAGGCGFLLVIGTPATIDHLYWTHLHTQNQPYRMDYRMDKDGNWT